MWCDSQHNITYLNQLIELTRNPNHNTVQHHVISCHGWVLIDTFDLCFLHMMWPIYYYITSTACKHEVLAINWVQFMSHLLFIYLWFVFMYVCMWPDVMHKHHPLCHGSQVTGLYVCMQCMYHMKLNGWLTFSTLIHCRISYHLQVFDTCQFLHWQVSQHWVYHTASSTAVIRNHVMPIFVKMCTERSCHVWESERKINQLCMCTSH